MVTEIKLLFLVLIFPFSSALSDDEIIKIVNNYNTTWVARKYKSLPKYKGPIPDPRHRNHELINLILRRHSFGHEPFRRYRGNPPKSFDARQRWNYCDTIQDIHDQGSCGSCWAIAVASTIADRICIKHPKWRPVRISATALLTCVNGGRCENGHDPYDAWQYYVKHGLPTGGFYRTKDSCQPYLYPGLYDERGLPLTNNFEIPVMAAQPECKHTCIPSFNNSYKSQLHRGERMYVVAPDPDSIMTEILIHGPVVAIVQAFEDFENYESGIYEHVAGKSEGFHAVRIIGWGEENGTEYWLCANSWSRFWGEQGTFRIKRGVNEVLIEEAVTAGLPY